MTLMPSPRSLEHVRADDDCPTYDIQDLIPHGLQARIVLNGQVYQLRITRAGKLILTK